MQGDVSLVALKGNECNQQEFFLLCVRLHAGYREGLVADSKVSPWRVFGVGQGF